MKVVFTGLESSGKSLRLAQRIRDVIIRNSKWNKVTGVSRVIYSNLRLASHVEAWANELGVEIKYWKDVHELTDFYECDVIIDELGTYFDARRWPDLSADVKKWLRQGAKMGVEVYGTAQDFGQVDKAFRLLTNELYEITKLVGSRRPSATKPPVKHVWGVCLVKEKDPRELDSTSGKFDNKTFLPSFFFIGKDDCMMYNTQQKIDVSELAPYRHGLRKCSEPGCDFVKVLHT